MNTPTGFVLIGVGFEDERFEQPFTEVVAILDEMAFRALDADPTVLNAFVTSDLETSRAFLTVIHEADNYQTVERVRLLLPLP